MRGLSAGAQQFQGSGSTGYFPNVAVYLDNQSVQLPSRNLDVYVVDLNRIEVLEGPQGTLFGAGAEAGVIRYITNEPKLDKTEATVGAAYSVTAHGDPNTNLSAVLNLPLIADHMAVRAVIYDDSRGGYIDNVPATFTRKNTDLGIHYSAGAACSPVVNPFGPIGAPSASSPPLQFSVRARYEFALADYQTFVQASAAHSGHSFTQAGANPTIAAQGFVSTTRWRFEDPAFTTVDAAAGIAKDAWNAQLFVENLANANTSLFTNADQYIVAQTPMHPRVIGVKIGYSF